MPLRVFSSAGAFEKGKRPRPLSRLWRFLGLEPYGALNDAQIARRCVQASLIHPFVPCQVNHLHTAYHSGDMVGKKHLDPTVSVISYGLSSAGYDIRLGTNFKFPNTMPSANNVALDVLDPKNIRPNAFMSYRSSEPIVIPPRGFILGESVEYFKMPNDLIALAVGKSTYARVAMVTLVTPLEPGWEGILTLEIANLCDVPIIIYPNEGITQLVFLKIRPCLISYGTRAGKYQHQSGVTVSKVA